MRLTIPRLESAKGDSPASGATQSVDPPAVTAIRLAFGVGPQGGVDPTDDTFKPTYQVSLPVFSIGGLDPDGVYEFDATQLLETLRRRSQRRNWAMRVELELTQAAATVGLADIYIDSPSDAVTLRVLGTTGRGTTLPGGGRTITVATAIASQPGEVAALTGAYAVQLRDTDPDGDDDPTVLSVARSVNVDVTRFEFEAPA